MSVLITTRRLAVTAALAAAVGVGSAGCAASGSPAGGDVDLLADASPATADGGDPACTATQRWTALATVAPRVRDALAADPDLAAELDRTRGLPRDERRTELRNYLQSQPELTPQVRQARQTLQQYRDTCAVG